VLESGIGQDQVDPVGFNEQIEKITSFVDMNRAIEWKKKM